MSALNAWWISDSLGPYPFLNYSNYDGYGALYGANAIQPASIFSTNANSVLGNSLPLSNTEKLKCDMMRDFMNGQFKTGTQLLSSGIQNTPEDAELVQTFLRNMMQEVAQGLQQQPMGNTDEWRHV
jgi:hypothetical protein